MKAIKKREPRYEIEKLLRQFCDVSSHELSLLLGGMSGELEHGLRSMNLFERGKAIEVTLKALEKALHLTHNLRYFAVQNKLEFRARDFSQVVLDTIDRVEPDFKNHGIRLDVAIESNVIAEIDINSIEHILLNLLWNAVHAMPTGGKLSIKLEVKNQKTLLTFKDSGRGIENAEEIFEPNHEVFQDHHHPQQGLGLTVAKAIVESHGGEIKLKSKFREGTTITLSLPTQDPEKQTLFLEKRMYRRVQLSLHAELSVEKHIHKGKITVLSTHGCFFHTREPLSLNKNQTVGIQINYLDQETIQIPIARIASQLTSHNTPGFGIEFLEISEKAERVLAALVKSHSSY